MYAIVDIAGKQFKVTQDQQIFAPKMEGDAGASVEFDNILLVDDDGKVKVGSPKVKGAKVTAEILEHQKGDKVIVFKKKRRKGYKVKNGHRQEFTKLLIKDIKKLPDIHSDFHKNVLKTCKNNDIDIRTPLLLKKV